MHDADDATLMQALRVADPLDQTTLDAGARHRLEKSWRQATEQPATKRRPAPGPGRRPQLAAAVIAALVVIVSGTALGITVAQRHAARQAMVQQAATAGVDGSFRATVQYGDEPATRYHIADGRVHLRLDGSRRVGPPARWGGFGDVAPVLIDEYIVTVDQLFLRARTESQQRARWYRYTGSELSWGPGLVDTPQPQFAQGTAGFRQVRDDEAAARGLSRYSADVAAAELDFLGWFSPTHRNMSYEPGHATIDLWVDGDGMVRRMEEVPRGEAAAVTRFDRFDEVRPITPPSEEGGGVTLATDGHGMTLEASGDPALGDALRARLTAELEADDDVVAYGFLPRPSAEQDRIDDSRPSPDDRLFVVAARLRQGADASASLARFDLDAGTVDDGPTVEGYAYISSASVEHWIVLDG